MIDPRLTIEIREELNLAIWRLKAMVPPTSLVLATRGYVGDGSYRPGMNVLSIATPSEEWYRPEDLEMLMDVSVGEYGSLGVGARFAMVLPEDVQFGVGRMFQVHSSGGDLIFHPFRTVEDAAEWLQVPLSEVSSTEADPKLLWGPARLGV